MPGMMDTVLNLGLNDETRRRAWSRQTSNERFAYDAYRRFIQMFGRIVLRASPPSSFDARLRRGQGGAPARSWTPSWTPRRCARSSPSSSRSSSARPAAVPDRPARAAPAGDQARSSTRGWASAPSTTATATRSRTTWAPPSTCRRWSSATWATTPAPASPSPATRSPARSSCTASSCSNAQGEDVVAGIRTPSRSRDGRRYCAGGLRAVPGDRRAARADLPRHAGPGVHRRARQALHAADPHGKRTAAAAVKIAVDMVDEGLISKEEALHARRAEPGRAAPAAALRRGGARTRRRRRPADSARAWRPRRARRWARPSSTPTGRGAWATTGERSSWSGRRPRPTTSTA